MTPASNRGSKLRLHWLWNHVYKGVSVERGEGKRFLWLGWTTRKYKRRGW